MPKDVKNKIFGQIPTIDDLPDKNDANRLLHLYDKLNKCNLRSTYLLSKYDNSVKALFRVGSVSDEGLRTMELLKTCGILYADIVRDYKEYCYLQTMINQYHAQIDAIVGGYR